MQEASENKKTTIGNDLNGHVEKENEEVEELMKVDVLERVMK